MKKIFLVLVFVLVITTAAAADRIQPTADIGLFVDLDKFWKALQTKPVYQYVFENEFSDYKPQSNTIQYYIRYNIEGGASIICWLNKYQKIHAIRIIIEPWYLIRDDSYEAYEITQQVLESTGLLLYEDDFAAIDDLKKNQAESLGRNFFLKRYFDDDNLIVEIESIYNTATGLTPYKLQNVFTQSCDSNYVGACIPIVSYDLDCSDIPVANFYVIGDDKHRFDGDGNGVCCEPFPK